MTRAFLALLAFLPSAALAQTVSSTKHNLSVTGPGPVRSSEQTQICIFCHVPHRGAAGGGSRPGSTATYTPYASSTLVSPAPGQPSGATRTCLSCHDGTIAVGQTLAGSIPVTGGRITGGPAYLGLDLRLTHPVSFAPAPAPELRPPPDGDVVKLDGEGRVQCTSCHDPHRDAIDPIVRKFLIKDNRGSALCTTCHVKTYWLASSHQSSSKIFDASLGAHTGYATVADHGCQACHRSHESATTSRLLDAPEPGLCMRCHSGRVAGKDLSAEFAKAYVHPVFTADPTVHDAAEGPANPERRLPETSAAQPRHVVCSDCHDAHSATAQPAVAPFAGGALAGVWGIRLDGQRVEPAQLGYEVCLRCHGDSMNQPQQLGPTPPETVRRAIIDPNLRRRFDLAAPSFHPVAGPGRNGAVPGLVPPLTAQSIISCTDCHASDTGPGAGGAGPAGPHGSSYPHILERAFVTADGTVEDPTTYTLCYKCHDRDTLLSGASNFKPHRRHVVDNHAPCSACHDWHGVSGMQGNIINNAHLIDFDVSIVGPSAQGVRLYESVGAATGACTLSCHGRDHARLTY